MQSSQQQDGPLAKDLQSCDLEGGWGGGKELFFPLSTPQSDPLQKVVEITCM